MDIARHVFAHKSVGERLHRKCRHSKVLRGAHSVLNAVDNRSLFAATLMPIVAFPPSNLSVAQIEAEEYDDGFAQIVHSNQPTTIDAATLDQSQIAPGTDAGIQIGWDDEQPTVWLNNQIDLLRDRVGGTTNTAEAPLGVQGYRVDVRLVGQTASDSLSIVNGKLPFSPTSNVGATTNISGNEFWVAPRPYGQAPVTTPPMISRAGCQCTSHDGQDQAWCCPTRSCNCWPML